MSQSISTGKFFLISITYISIFLAPASCSLSLQGQSNYTNPVTPGLNISDPFVLQHEGQYFLYATTDVNEGFRAWRSNNLVDWEPIGWVFRKSDQTWGQGSFWAPEVIAYQDRFYLVYSSRGKTNFGEGMRICISVADRPEGPFQEFSTPLFDHAYGTIDGHIYIEDGKPYLYFEMVGAVGNFTQEKGFLWGIIMGAELASDLSKLIAEPKLCIYPSQEWEGIHSMWARSNEGMTVLKKDSTYYMMYSGNHWADPNYGIGYATSDRPLGSLWTKFKGNPILQKDLEKGVSGPGHNCLIPSPDSSELFIVYHSHILDNRTGASINLDTGKRLGRTINIDRITFNEEGSLSVIGPTRSPQPMPSGSQ